MAVVETLELRFQANLDQLGAQLKALSARIAGLGAAMEAGNAGLSGAAANLVRGVAEALRSSAGMSTAPEAAGGLMANGFARGIAGGQGLAVGAARALCASARFSDAGAVSAAQSAGAALGQGFANGISGKYGAVMRAADRIASAAVSRIRSALKIHSPSRVSFALGGFFGEGFAEGVCDSIRLAEEGAAALSAGAATALSPEGGAARASAAGADGIPGAVRAAVQEALGGTEIVIPLYVDGMKLGEASIRGINQVTRSAGRLLLEI